MGLCALTLIPIFWLLYLANGSDAYVRFIASTFQPIIESLPLKSAVFMDGVLVELNSGKYSLPISGIPLLYLSGMAVTMLIYCDSLNFAKKTAVVLGAAVYGYLIELSFLVYALLSAVNNGDSFLDFFIFLRWVVNISCMALIWFLFWWNRSEGLNDV